MCVCLCVRKWRPEGRKKLELGFLSCSFSFSIMVCGRVQHTLVKNERATEIRRSANHRKEQRK